MDQIKEVSEKTLNFYKNGKYNDDVRMVYEDLLSTRLSTRNVERCVRLVLEKLAEAKVGRLPKVTFAKDMFLEARGLAQIHVVTKLLDSKENPFILMEPVKTAIPTPHLMFKVGKMFSLLD